MTDPQPASQVLSFLRIGTPSVLLDGPRLEWAAELGFSDFFLDRDHPGWPTKVRRLDPEAVQHRLSVDTIELVSPAGTVLAAWSAPASRVWRVVAAQPSPTWVAFFAMEHGVVGSIDEATFLAEVEAGRVMAGHIAPHTRGSRPR